MLRKINETVGRELEHYPRGARGSAQTCSAPSTRWCAHRASAARSHGADLAPSVQPKPQRLSARPTQVSRHTRCDGRSPPRSLHGQRRSSGRSVNVRTIGRCSPIAIANAFAQFASVTVVPTAAHAGHRPTLRVTRCVIGPPVGDRGKPRSRRSGAAPRDVQRRTRRSFRCGVSAVARSQR